MRKQILKRADFQSQRAKCAHLLVDVQSISIVFIVPLQKLVMHVWSRSFVFSNITNLEGKDFLNTTLLYMCKLTDFAALSGV